MGTRTPDISFSEAKLREVAGGDNGPREADLSPKRADGACGKTGSVNFSQLLTRNSSSTGGASPRNLAAQGQERSARGGSKNLVVTRIEVLVLQGASPSSVALTIELLDTANQLQEFTGGRAPFAISLTGSGADTARAFLGYSGATAAFQPAEIIIVPGLRLASEAALQERFRQEDAEDARRRLIAAAQRGAQLATSCTGVFLLASTGLLDGRRATTSGWLTPVLRRQFPAVRLEADGGLVVDGNTITAGPPLAQLDLVLSVVARHASAELARRCARHLLLDDHHSSAQYMAASFLSVMDDQVASAERWALNRLDESIAIPQLAQAAGMTARTFARRLRKATGLSPVRFLQQLRVRQAVDLLNTTRLSLDEIARRVGYSEPSTLRRLLRREGAAGARETRSRSVGRCVSRGA